MSDREGHTTMADANSYAIEIKVFRDPKFYGNGMRYPTPELADEAGRNKLMNWMAAEEYRVVPSVDAPNVAVPEAAAAA